jgi:hypothetical protein
MKVAKLGGHGWLKKLFVGKQDEEEEEETQQSEKQPEEQSSAVSVQTQQTVDDEENRLEIENGSLLRLWRQWKKDDLSTPPPLSLTGGDPKLQLPLSGNQAISREKLRLKAQLEKDARERLRVMETDGPDKDRDAECRVYQSRYGMVAWVFIFPPVGGGKLHMDAVGKALQTSGVTSGIDSSMVLRLVQEEAFFQLIPIACGTQPVEGKDGYVVEHYPREFQRAIKIDENGVADYRSITYVQVIQKGDVICDIFPPVEGQAGLRVDGKILEPKRVHPAKIPAGGNTELSEDGQHLVASIDGHIVFSKDAFMVRPLLDIKGDVDYSTGNVDFRGDVHIHGDVRENFFVRATGTVTVDGTVEAANIEAGGDILVSCGVLGDNRATIKSAGCIRVKYLESCVAYASQGVYADCIMSAQVFSDDEISVTTGRGTVIGGSLTAGRKITARMIGSQSGMKTSLVLGVLPYNQEKMRNDSADLKTIHMEMEELSKTLEQLEQEAQQGMAGMNEKLAKARLRKSVLSMKESQLLKHKEQLNQPTSVDLSKCRLECDMIYPASSLRIQNATWTTSQVRKACKLGYDEMTADIREIYV